MASRKNGKDSIIAVQASGIFDPYDISGQPRPIAKFVGTVVIGQKMGDKRSSLAIDRVQQAVPVRAIRSSPLLV